MNRFPTNQLSRRRLLQAGSIGAVGSTARSRSLSAVGAARLWPEPMAGRIRAFFVTFGVFAAFLAGAISFLSPCVLPLVPGYVSFIAGQPGLRTAWHVGMVARSRALGLSACFVLGFSTVFVALGAGASALGSLLLTWRTELNLVGGAIIVLFGLVMLGVLRFGGLARDTRFHLDVPGGLKGAVIEFGFASVGATAWMTRFSPKR